MKTCYKECELLMVQSDEKANIQKFGNQLRTNKFKAENLAYWMNLYLVSNEEIKEGDWYLQFYPNGEFKTPQRCKAGIYANLKEINSNENCKKIIATTDKSLMIGFSNKSLNSDYLPQIPQSFIEKFVEEYNKGNIITKVMVEYEYQYHSSKEFYGNEADWVTCDESQYNSIKKEIPSCPIRIILKTNPDNTINIKLPEQKTYTREQVIELKNKLVSLPKEEQIKILDTVESFDKWIEKILK